MSIPFSWTPASHRPSAASDVTVTKWDGSAVTLATPVSIDANGKVSFAVSTSGTYRVAVKRITGTETYTITLQAPEEKSILGPTVTESQLALALVGNPDSIISGSITRDANGAVTSAAVRWPDGTRGTYTSLVVSTSFPGAVDSYQITYGIPAVVTYTQPAVTRDATGAVSVRPDITVA